MASSITILSYFQNNKDRPQFLIICIKNIVFFFGKATCVLIIFLLFYPKTAACGRSLRRSYQLQLVVCHIGMCSIMLTYILEVLSNLSCLLVYRAQSVIESYFLTCNEEAELIFSGLVLFL